LPPNSKPQGEEIKSKTTLSLELRKIKAIEFECSTFHTKVVYLIEKYTHPIAMCNVCQPPKQFIVPNNQESKDLIMLGELVRTLSQVDPARAFVSVHESDCSADDGFINNPQL
jgi:hypothetical protein